MINGTEQKIIEEMTSIEWEFHKNLKDCWEAYLLASTGNKEMKGRYRHALGNEVSQDWVDHPALTVWGWSEGKRKCIHLWIAEKFDITELIRTVAHEMAHQMGKRCKTKRQEEIKATNIEMISLMAYLLAMGYEKKQRVTKRDNKSKLRYKHTNINQGKCRDCSKPAVRNKHHCEEHIKKAAERNKRLRAKRKAAGQCIRCGNNLLVDADGANVSCINCTMVRKLYF